MYTTRNGNVVQVSLCLVSKNNKLLILILLELIENCYKQTFRKRHEFHNNERCKIAGWGYNSIITLKEKTKKYLKLNEKL